VFQDQVNGLLSFKTSMCLMCEEWPTSISNILHFSERHTLMIHMEIVEYLRCTSPWRYWSIWDEKLCGGVMGVCSAGELHVWSKTTSYLCVPLLVISHTKWPWNLNAAMLVAQTSKKVKLIIIKQHISMYSNHNCFLHFCIVLLSN